MCSLFFFHCTTTLATRLKTNKKYLSRNLLVTCKSEIRIYEKMNESLITSKNSPHVNSSKNRLRRCIHESWFMYMLSFRKENRKFITLILFIIYYLSILMNHLFNKTKWEKYDSYFHRIHYWTIRFFLDCRCENTRPIK